MSEHSRLNAAETEEIRRLLADARHSDPMPAPVVERLDRVLADLASEPARTATVVRLAERRRRAARMLVAAAAAIVVGLGVAQVVGEGAGPSAGPASEDASRAEGEDAAGGESVVTQGEAAPSADAEAAPQALGSTRARPYRIAAESFAEDAAALQPRASAGTMQQYSADDKDATGDRGRPRDELRARRTPPRAAEQVLCARGPWGRGSYLPVIYDGTPGWVVLRNPQGESQVADLFLCGSELAVRSVTLPLP